MTFPGDPVDGRCYCSEAHSKTSTRYSHLAMHTIYCIDAEVMLFTLGGVVKVELRLIFP